MPEMHVHVRWPDDSEMACYSPSLIMREYLEIGAAYPVPEFLERSRTALTLGSERIREKFGFPCSRAAAQLAQIEAKARAFTTPGAAVRIESYGA